MSLNIVAGVITLLLVEAEVFADPRVEVDALLHGIPTKRLRVGSDTPGKRSGVNVTYQIHLDNGIHGYFKPENGYADHLREVSAFRLDELLGVGLVPPTVLRELNFSGKNVFGSFQLGKEGLEANKVPLHEKSQRLRLLDYLLGNCDRNEGNYLILEGQEIAIDNGLAFSTSTCQTILENVNNLYPRDQIPSLPTNPPADIIEKLKLVSDSVFEETLGLTSSQKFSDFIERKNCVILWYDALQGDLEAVKSRIRSCGPTFFNESLLRESMKRGTYEAEKVLIRAEAEVTAKQEKSKSLSKYFWDAIDNHDIQRIEDFLSDPVLIDSVEFHQSC